MKPARLPSAAAAWFLAVLAAPLMGESNWRVYQRGDGLALDSCVSVTVSAQGDVLVGHGSASWLSQLNGYSITNFPTADGLHGKVYLSPAGQPWTMGTNGLQEYRDGAWILHQAGVIGIQGAELSGGRFKSIPVVPVRQGRVLILLADRLLLFSSETPEQPHSEILRRHEQTIIGQFSGMVRARDGGLWISGKKGVAKLAGSLRNIGPEAKWHEYTPPEPTPADDFHDPHEDAKGGLVLLATSRTNAAHQFVASLRISEWQWTRVEDEVLSHAWRDDEDVLWGMAGDALLQWDRGTSQFVESPGGGPRHCRDVAVEPAGTFWIAAGDGLYWHAAALWRRMPRKEEQTVDVPQVTNPASAPGPPAGASVGRTSRLWPMRNGDVWAGAERGTAWLHEGKWQYFQAENAAPADPVSLVEQSDGSVWCATSQRVWKFEGKQWVDARRGFNEIRGLLAARDGSLWVATQAGLFRYFHGAWIEHSMEEGLPSDNIREVWEERGNRVWVDTEKGAATFNAAADSDAPRVTVRLNAADRKKIYEGDILTVSFEGIDKWNFTRASRLLFSTRLDAAEWSGFEDAHAAVLKGLTAGKHVFQARVMDRNGNMEPKPVSLEFAVVVPWYREARLVLSWAFGAALVLFFAGLAFNRHLRLRRSYAEIEKKIAERTLELERANEELLHSQKMNALGTLAAGIAHDFNNILSIIEGSAQLIEENVNNPQKVRTRVSRIRTMVEQGSGIVKAMLGFSRESPPAGACEINQVVGDTIRLLGDRFLREVRIEFSGGQDLPLVAGSRDFIQQILLNLVFNAAESMASAKQIQIRTWECESFPTLPVLFPAKAARYVCVSVKDSGCGIPPEILPRIFEPFFTTKALSTRRGTGLGLSMVYELAKKLGAGIAVESVANRGSTFSILLPVAPDETLNDAGGRKEAEERATAISKS